MWRICSRPMESPREDQKEMQAGAQEKKQRLPISIPIAWCSQGLWSHDAVRLEAVFPLKMSHGNVGFWSVMAVDGNAMAARGKFNGS